MKYTKQEVYTSIIDIQKKTGQGLSGIVKVKSADFSKYINELIEEGLVKACDTGGSLGHPESNIFYMPTKGYNVWEDNEGNGTAGFRSDCGKYLHFVRVYLGCLTFKDREVLPDEQDELKQKFLNPTMFDYLRSPAQMKLYSEWLERNHEELEIMRNLDDYYEEPIINFTKEDLDHIKTRDWYEKNQPISVCLNDSISKVKNLKEHSRLSRQILELYESDDVKYKSELDKTTIEIKENDDEILFRKKLHRWFEQKNQDSLIQDLI